MNSKSILLIEDDKEIRESIVDILQDEGYDIITAHNGEEALELLTESHEMPGLVLLDLMMPVMDGKRFREEQIKDPRLANVPTILFSADAQLEKKAEKIGIVEYVKKPIDLNQLLDLIKKYCG